MVIDMNEKICGKNCTLLRHTTIKGEHFYQCLNHISPSIEGLKETCMFDMIKNKGDKND